MLRSLGADIVQRLSFFLDDDDPRWRVLVIRVLVQKLSLVLLIDGKDVLPGSLYFHQQVSRLLSLGLDVDGAVQECWVELADNDLSEVDLEILPGHVKGAIVGVAIVVVLVS